MELQYSPNYPSLKKQWSIYLLHVFLHDLQLTMRWMHHQLVKMLSKLAERANYFFIFLFYGDLIQGRKMKLIKFQMKARDGIATTQP